MCFIQTYQVTCQKKKRYTSYLQSKKEIPEIKQTLCLQSEDFIPPIHQLLCCAGQILLAVRGSTSLHNFRPWLLKSPRMMQVDHPLPYNALGKNIAPLRRATHF